MSSELPSLRGGLRGGETWRLLVDGAADGATNMSIDEAILHSVAAGQSPTLRFYQWNPPTISLGYTQSAALVDSPLDVVRRITGGRTVLHQHELTYMICIPADDWRVKDGVLASYRRISAGLAAGLRQLGVELDAVGVDVRANRDSAACFDQPSASEIVVRGRKLIGSAQTRRRGVVLQHGSIPLYGDVGTIVDHLSLSLSERDSLRRHLRHHATTLTWALGKTPHISDVICALLNGLSTALDIQFTEGEMTVTENLLATQLRDEKYLMEMWTHQRKQSGLVVRPDTTSPLVEKEKTR